MITRIKIQNFGSLLDVDVTLGPLTLLVGPNASGKTMFIRALRTFTKLLRSVLRGPRGELSLDHATLDDLVSCNDPSREIRFSVWIDDPDADPSYELVLAKRKRLWIIAEERLRYGSFRFDSREGPLEFSTERLDAIRWQTPGDPPRNATLPYLAYPYRQDRHALITLQPLLDLQSAVGVTRGFRIATPNLVRPGLPPWIKADSPVCVGLEEPEAGTHPFFQQNRLELLRRLVRPGTAPRPLQIIATTHSVDLLRWVKEEEALDMLRFVEHLGDDQGTKIHRLTRQDDLERVYEEYDRNLGLAWYSGALGAEPETRPAADVVVLSMDGDKRVAFERTVARLPADLREKVIPVVFEPEYEVLFTRSKRPFETAFGLPFCSTSPPRRDGDLKKSMQEWLRQYQPERRLDADLRRELARHLDVGPNSELEEIDAWRDLLAGLSKCQGATKIQKGRP